MPGPVETAQPMSFDAEYTLETPLRCSRCQSEITTVGVVRLIRSKVNFTSTLPRRGHLIVCPSCRAIVSGALGGIA
jgi:hypothetical protein